MDTDCSDLGVSLPEIFAAIAWGCPSPNRKLPAPQFNRPPLRDGSSRRANQRNPSTEWLESTSEKMKG